MARRLVDLCHVDGGTDNGPVPIPVTQDDLASLAGTSRPTANRVVGEPEQAGVVAVGRGRIDIIDRGGLTRCTR